MAEIDLTPTEEMAANAARGLDLREKHGRGGTEIGVARARDIKNRKNLSPETVRRMNSYFARHEVDKQGEGWGEDSAGYIAWLLWGGDAGRAWAKRKAEQMDKGENQRSDTYKEIAQRLGSAAKNDRPGAKARFELRPGDRKLGEALLAEASDLRGKIAKKRNELDSTDQTLTTAIQQMKKALSTADDAAFEEAKLSIRSAQNVRKSFSRPGAKARMSKDWQTIERYLEVLDTEFGEPRGKAAAQEMLRAAAAIGGSEGTALKNAINVMASNRDYGARQRAYNAIEAMIPMSRPGAKARMGNAERLDSLLAATYRALRNNDKAAAKRLLADAAKEIDSSTPQNLLYDFKELKASMSRPGAKARMGKAADAFNYIKNSIASGKTVYVTAGSRTTKVTPQTYAKWEASGRPLFKLGGDGALLMASGSSYVRLTMGDDMMLASVTAMSRPGAKARFGITKEQIRRASREELRSIEQRLMALAKAGDKNAAALLDYVEEEYNDRYRGTHARPGAKARMGRQWREGPYAFKNKLLAEDQMQLLVNEGSGWMNAGVFMDDSDTIEAAKSYVQMRKRGFVYEHGQWNKARASRPGAKVANAVREGEKVSASDTAVSRKIRKLMDEGKPQKQAVAIALDLERRGEL